MLVVILAGICCCLAQSLIPSFYLDPVIEKILLDERKFCLRDKSSSSELYHLRSESAGDFLRSHELFAHKYFVEDVTNPNRRNSLKDADFEYIPLMMLSWRVDSSSKCSYQSLIQSILKAQLYLENRDKKTGNSKPKFTVCSTYNLRTEMGKGMPTQVRRGEAWTNVSNFIMSLSIGHYERYHQCPDLLRKTWKYVVELPFVPMNTIFMKSNNANIIAKSNSVEVARQYMFHFSGNFELFGPEMVCSVRNAVLNVHNRGDTLVINTTIADAIKPIDFIIQTAMEHSIFCLITKGDSYSTSFLYNAIATGCIPIVISDWWVFAFPWIIPYEKFMIRVNEVDFIKNANGVLDHIATTIGNNQPLLASMRYYMNIAKSLLSFNKIPYLSEEYMQLLSNDVYIGENYKQGKYKSLIDNYKSSNGGSSNNKAYETIIPFDLLLLELRYVQTPYRYYNNIPCYRPYMCVHYRDNKTATIDAKNNDYYFYPKGSATLEILPDINVIDSKILKNNNVKGVISTAGVSSSTAGAATGTGGGVRGYRVSDSGYQVNPLDLNHIEDKRSHLCKHAPRLIGMYKIVFYMQCVRILWPITPGQFRNPDNIQKFNNTKVNYDKKGNIIKDERGITLFDYNYVLQFHNLTKRPDNWIVDNYPVEIEYKGKLHTIQTVKQLLKGF